MSDSDVLIRKLLAGYWADHGLALSTGLLKHESFLIKFHPTGQTDRDIAAFLIGAGQHRMLERYRQLNLPLTGLAGEIRRNHRGELKLLRRGDPPQWGGYQRWTSEQLRYYQHLLELEKSILDAILDSSERKGTTAA